MTTLGEPAALLAAWEAAMAVPAVARGAVLVHGAGLTPDLDAALELDVGGCAALALRAHLDAFGAELEGLSDCPSCGERIEVAMRLADVSPGQDTGGFARVGDLVVRPPSIRDLLAVVGADDVTGELVGRCVRRVDGAPVVGAELSVAELAEIDEVAERLAGPAACTVATVCPGCAGSVEVALDLTAVLWDRVDAAAPAVLAEVARLACAFGWTEEAVLGLSTVRRQAYLALVPG